MRGASNTKVLLVSSVTFLLAAASSPAVSPKSSAENPGPFIVHEWGTFLTVQGSDGVTLGGMVDNDEVLPAFVESRSIANWQRSLLRVKGETPVTYFYTDRPRIVQVRVDMPEGILTHWYPNVCRFGPSPLLKPAGAPRNSYLDWCSITLLPTTPSTGAEELKQEIITTKKGQVFTGFVISENAKEVDLIQLRRTGIRSIAKNDIGERSLAQARTDSAPEGAIKRSVRTTESLLPVGNEQTWRYVRETDSALVRQETFTARNEPVVQFEKFLFYRGVGTFPMPLNVACREGHRGGLSLSMQNTSAQSLHGLFVLQVEDGKIRFGRLDDMAGKASQSSVLDDRLSPALPLDEGVPQIKDAVASVLVQSGLYDKEARAMVNTWERSYFRTEGLRVLYVVPRERVDAVLPIHIKPDPDRLVRVMVGRIEVLTPARERQIEKFVGDLGASDFTTREAASTGLARLGRLGEPALRRVLATTADAEVRARAQVLIAKAGTAK